MWKEKDSINLGIIATSLAKLANYKVEEQVNSEADTNLEMSSVNFEDLEEETITSARDKAEAILNQQSDKGFFEEDGLPAELIEMM